MAENERVLIIACSGGGGHISAANGIISELDEGSVPDHYPVKRRRAKDSSLIRLIYKGVFVINGMKFLKPVMRQAVANSPYPVLPDKDSLVKECEALEGKNDTSKPRKYVDMLLDVYPAGYESAAIWNVLQRQGRVNDLRKLINLQAKSDRENYQHVYKHFLNMLKDALAAGKPYAKITSTQAMALPALCDAVLEYNKKHEPKVKIEQYMTDLPTDGAIHFANSLKGLTPEQRGVMELYGVGMNDEFEAMIGPGWAKLEDVQPNENPMVRPGFKDSSTSLHDSFEEECEVNYIDYTEDGLKLDVNATKTIEAGEQVASIMLGSQASDDTVLYMISLLESGYDKVFVFGGLNPNISARIDDYLKKDNNAQYEQKVIKLGNQSDKEMQPIMTRSNALFVRSGGLSVMEQLAMEHNPNQSIFIHHTDGSNFKSGISWEDANADILIKSMEDKGVHAQKISPSTAKRSITVAKDFATAMPKAEGLQTKMSNSVFKKLSLQLRHELLYVKEKKKDAASPKTRLKNRKKRAERQTKLEEMQNWLKENSTTEELAEQFINEFYVKSDPPHEACFARIYKVANDISPVSSTELKTSVMQKLHSKRETKQVFREIANERQLKISNQIN